MDEYDIVVAGGGIAGLTAGLTAARLGRRTLVVTGDVLGGQLLSVEKIDGYPGFPDGVPGYDLGPMAQEQAANAGAEFLTGDVTSLERGEGGWRVSTSDGEMRARAVIVATGTSLRTLGIPGEEKFAGKGVSHCATCDGPLHRDNVVAVVGGGDSGFQEALTLAEFTRRVIIFERDGSPHAQAAYRERVAADSRIEVRCNAIVEEVLGAESVKGLRVRDAASGEIATVDVGGVFVYVGLRPNAAFLDGVITLDATGAIPVDQDLRAGAEGLYAAGSVRAGAAFRAASSAGEGAAAAVTADRDLTAGRPRDAQ